MYVTLCDSVYNCIKFSHSTIYEHAKRIPYDVRRMEIFPYKAEHKHFGILRKTFRVVFLENNTGRLNRRGIFFSKSKVLTYAKVASLISRVKSNIQVFSVSKKYSKTLNKRPVDLQNKLVSNFNKLIYKSNWRPAG